MVYKVTKKIPSGDGSFIDVGEIVDASGWRNLKSLISNRYLMPWVEVAPEKISETKPKAKVSSEKK